MEKNFDKIVEAVCNDLNQRSIVGQQKYGVTLERTDLNLHDWLQHAYEEALDLANYLKRAIMEIEVQRNTKEIRIRELIANLNQLREQGMSDERHKRMKWFIDQITAP